MAKKRQTVIGKWDDPWFMALSPQSKLVWLYLCDTCDFIGIYEYNEVLMKVRIGFSDKVDVKKHFSDLDEKIDWFPGKKKLWVKNFISVQYGVLDREENEKVSSIHVSVLKELGKYSGVDKIPGSLKDFISSVLNSISRVQVGYTYPSKNKKKKKKKEGGVGETEIQYTIDHCLTVALADDRWTEANKTSEKELKQFNSLLEKRGVYKRNPMDYKSHFANWKLSGKKDEVINKFSSNGAAPLRTY